MSKEQLKAIYDYLWYARTSMVAGPTYENRLAELVELDELLDVVYKEMK